MNIYRVAPKNTILKSARCQRRKVSDFMFFDHITIVPLTKHTQIKRMLREVEFMGCVLDYVPFEHEGAIDFALHRQRAIDAMKVLQRSSEIFARNQKLNPYFEVALDKTSLHGQLIEATQFWGNDDFENKWENGVSFGPVVDGYKTAFFNPPQLVRFVVRGTNSTFRQAQYAIVER